MVLDELAALARGTQSLFAYLWSVLVVPASGERTRCGTTYVVMRPLVCPRGARLRRTHTLWQPRRRGARLWRTHTLWHRHGAAAHWVWCYRTGYGATALEWC